MRDITLDELCLFSDQSRVTVTVDAPLFGVVTIMHGRVLLRGTLEGGKVGSCIGFPPRDQILAEASRFWILYSNGIRERKDRGEMLRLIDEKRRAAGAG